MTREHDSAGRSRRQFLKTAAATGVVAGFSAVSFAQDQQTTEPPLLKFGGRIPGWQGYAPEPISGATNPTLNLEQNRVYTVMWKNVDGAPHNFALLDEQGNALPVIKLLVRQSTDVAINETNATELNATNMTGGNMTGNLTNATGNQTTPAETTAANQTGNATGNQTQVTKLEGNLLERTPTISQQGAVQILQFETTENVAQYQCTIHPTTMVGDVQFGGGGIGGNQTGNATGNQTGGNQSGGNGNGGN